MKQKLLYAITTCRDIDADFLVPDQVYRSISFTFRLLSYLDYYFLFICFLKLFSLAYNYHRERIGPTQELIVI